MPSRSWLTLAVAALCGVADGAAPSLRGSVAPPKPPYRVSPLVHTFDALPGQELDFEFTVEAIERNVTLAVSPVGLRQKLTGVILPAEDAAGAADIRLLAPGPIVVRRGERKTVEGRWRLPAGTPGYHMAGVTLTDVSDDSAAPTTPVAEAGGAGAAVRFLTRYLLRLEANVAGGSRVSAPPEVVAGALVERSGLALATALLQADAAQGGACRVRGLLWKDDLPIGKAFAMRLPSRVGMPAPEGDTAPIVAGGRVMVVAPVSEPLFPGDYRLEVSVARGGVAPQKRRFDLVVGPDDFPAQRTVVAQVVRDVAVAPNQLELSVAKGGNRLRPLRLTNRSDQAVSVRVVTNGADRADGAEAVDWLVVRPTEFVLRPRSTRQVLVALRGGGRHEVNRYANLRVEVMPTETAVGGSHELPVALVTESASAAGWRLGERLAFASGGSGQKPAVEATLKNDGVTHLAPHAKITLVDALDRQVASEAGYGRWVLPGATARLRFPTPRLPPGRYDATIELTPAPGAPTEVANRRLEIR